MLFDLLSSDNYVSYNVKIAKEMGLYAAVYLAELININRKAINKQRIDNNCFTVNRQYIEERTTLNIDTQLVLDKKLQEVGVLAKKEGSPDEMYIDANALTNLVAAGDVKLLARVSKITKLDNVGGVANAKITQRQRDMQLCKTAISTTNTELQTALSGWIEGVYARPNGFLSRRAVTIFQNELYKYTNGDLDLALKLVDIATITGYKEFQWVQKKFEDEYAATFRRQYSPSVPTPIKRVTTGDLGEEF